MDNAEAIALLDELKALAKQPPGADPGAAAQVASLLMRIPGNDSYTREKLAAVRDSFERWFSARRWNSAGDGGLKARSNLNNDIAKLEGALRL